MAVHESIVSEVLSDIHIGVKASLFENEKVDILIWSEGKMIIIIFNWIDDFAGNQAMEKINAIPGYYKVDIFCLF